MNNRRVTAWLVADSKEEALRTIEKLQRELAKVPDCVNSIKY